MSSNKELRRAKRAAYEAKQEKKGKEIVGWIFGALVVLAIIYLIVIVSFA